MELRAYFITDLPPRQRQYEAIRAIAFNEGNIKNIAARFHGWIINLSRLSGRHKIMTLKNPVKIGDEYYQKYGT